MQSVYTDFRARHFRLFEDVSVQFAPITIISGKNNTGKTALLEAVFLHAAGPRVGSMSLALGAARNATPVILSQPDDQTAWDSLFRNNETTAPVILTAKLGNSAIEVRLSVPMSDESLTTLSPGGVGAETRTQSLAVVAEIDGVVREYKQTATQQFFGPQSAGPFSVQVGGINIRLDPPGEALVPANIITSGTRSNQAEIAQRYSDLRVLGRQRDLINAIKEVDPRLSGMEVLVKEGQPLLHLSIAGYSQPLPLSLFGEGMVAAIDVLSLIYAKRSRVVLIDEVENGIHYTVLSGFWRHIKHAARAAGTQVIATTHSRECIEAAKGAFGKDAEDDLRLLRLWRKSPQSDVSVSAYDFGEIESALELGLDVR
jgi:hypothetical protein